MTQRFKNHKQWNDIPFYLIGLLLMIAGYRVHPSWIWCIVFVWGGLGRWMVQQRWKKEKNDWEKQSMLDATGVLSKTSWSESFERERKRSLHKKNPLSLILVEASNVREINQKFDRLEGDDCMKAIALSLSSCARPTDYTGRVSGLYFGLLMPDTSAEERLMIEERVKKTLTNIVRSHEKGEVHVKVKVGGAVLDPEESCVSFLTRLEKEVASEELLESTGGAVDDLKK